jgi:signal transduction histidine kinase
MRFGADGKRLALSVQDPFGSLDAAKVIDYLTKCFRRGDDQIDQKEGGAGLGLYLMYESLSHFVVNIHAGRRTELIGVVDITGSYREFARRSKSFNVFLEGELNE